jgi:hypothetical protein
MRSIGATELRIMRVTGLNYESRVDQALVECELNRRERLKGFGPMFGVADTSARSNQHWSSR